MPGFHDELLTTMAFEPGKPLTEKDLRSAVSDLLQNSPKGYWSRRDNPTPVSDIRPTSRNWLIADAGNGTTTDAGGKSPNSGSLLDSLHEQYRGIPRISPPVGGKAEIDYTPDVKTFPPISKDPAVYATLVEKYPHAKSMTYHPDAVALVRSARDDILKASHETGVPPEAIAGAMLDEKTKINQRYKGGADFFQDLGAKFLTSFSSSNLSYDTMKRYVDNTPEDKRIRGGLTFAPMWDLGPYNINAALGLELFQQYVLDPKAGDNSLRTLTLEGLPPNSSTQEKWQSFIQRCLLDPRGGAYVAAIVMRDGAKQLKPFMRGASAEEKAALLVTCYKQGIETMKRLYAERVKQTGDTSHMRPGEGAIIFHNMGTIRDIVDQ